MICQANIWNSACTLSMKPYLIRLLDPYSTWVRRPWYYLYTTACLMLGLSHAWSRHLPDYKTRIAGPRVHCLGCLFFSSFFKINEYLLGFVFQLTRTVCAAPAFYNWVTWQRQVDSVFAWWKFFVVFRENGSERGLKSYRYGVDTPWKEPGKFWVWTVMLKWK